MNCQANLLPVMYRLTAVDLKTFEMSFDAALKLLALSDMINFYLATLIALQSV